MTDYHILLSDSIKVNDSIITQVDFTVILNEVLNFITTLGGLISWVLTLRKKFVPIAKGNITNMIEDH